ncbi:hypothetical protein D910_02256 [Dendroctonus ponderosae]|uniref:Uncharacterized protein n=1 Tax=Dendroctonus ponderosae TaxID=77166 RepID=U4TVN8_DENPD|nr:hypothetical protein D910_02256 [Dendroctonus ponderosae]
MRLLKYVYFQFDPPLQYINSIVTDSIWVTREPNFNAKTIKEGRAVFCLTNLMGITPGSDIFSMNINWGLLYELPNETKPLLDVYKPAMKRRNRRDLYSRIEKVLNS